MNDTFISKPNAQVLPAKKKLLIATTVPDTLEFILESQPRFLNGNYQVVVVSSELERLKNFAGNEGVDCVSVEMARGISPFQDIISIFRMYRVLCEIRPDLVHSYTPKAGMVCAISGFFAAIPIRIHTFTGLIFPYCSGVKRWLLKSIDWLVCCLNTHIIPEGRGVQTDLASVCTKPMSVIGYGNIAGVDLQHFDPELPHLKNAAVELRTNHNLANKTVFCFVGRLNNDKGIKELCQAFLQLDPKHHALIVVGALDTENPIDPDTLVQLQNAPGICWLGFQSDVRAALAVSDVFVLPSYREGFPNVVIQAGAMAKPSLVTNVSGSNEIVEHGVNGWIVEPKNTNALFSQMVEISNLSNLELQQKGHNALHLVRERYDRRYYQSELLKFYQEVLS
ncbi:MAG: glycosyltransferase family 4 protein [Gammaproteobacteria bacterium]|nr:glycosyltransferase family 4 protein [Gammaproteobacteria bacterium]